MVERVVIGYRRLFEVRLLDHYWLDEGATVFDQINDPAQKDARLLTYDVRPFLTVEPTPTTAKALAGYRCLFRATALGLVVAAPSTTVIAADASFEFVVSIANGTFNDHTALTLRPQKIYELFNTADGITYRYKENVSVLSNLSGVTRGAAARQDRRHDLGLFQRRPLLLEKRPDLPAVPARLAPPLDRAQAARDRVSQEQGAAVRPHVAHDLTEGGLLKLLEIIDLLQLPGEVVQEPLPILARGRGACRRPVRIGAPRRAGSGRRRVSGRGR